MTRRTAPSPTAALPSAGRRAATVPPAAPPAQARRLQLVSLTLE